MFVSERDERNVSKSEWCTVCASESYVQSVCMW
jgi:hypothetical protein